MDRINEADDKKYKKDKGYHPATYPVELAEHCIKLSGLKEGVIVDPFVGTGTTIQAVKASK